jgi:hypothetical protein
MQELPVDIEDRQPVIENIDDMAVPDLVHQRARLSHDAPFSLFSERAPAQR